MSVASRRAVFISGQGSNLKALLDKKGVPYGDTYLGYFPMLHKTIPTKESMSVFNKDLKKVAEFQIMRRD